MWKKGTSPLFPALFSPRAMVGNGEGFPHRRGRGTLSTGFPRGIHREMWAKAPLPLTGSLNNAFGSTVAAHKRQRRKREVSSSHGATWNLFCERAVHGIKIRKV